jgi:stage II sporulation protein D
MKNLRLIFWALTSLALLAGCSPYRGAPLGQSSSARERAREQRLDNWRSNPRLLRVGLFAGVDQADIGLTGPVEFLDVSTDGARPLGKQDAAGQWNLSVTAEGALMARAVSGSRDFVIPLGHSLLFHPVDSGHVLEVNGRPHAGDVMVMCRSEGLTVVNVVDLETYLRGVVPWEIGRPGEKGLAALEAQAVAARTYTVSHLEERRDHGFDVWADTRDQVYKGLEGTDRWCDKAITNTAGLVLRYHGIEIEAYYSSTCGGRSSNIHEVWSRPARPYLKSHSDRKGRGTAYCSESSQFTWNETWTFAELEAALKTNLPAYLDWLEASALRQRWAGTAFQPATTGVDPRQPGRVRDIRVKSRTSSGRAEILEIVTEAGKYRIRGDRVRWVLRPASGRFSILRSAWIDVQLQRDRAGAIEQLVVNGRGFGHGVGMCQTGALGMARAGATSHQILKHYYPDTSLESAWRP